MSEGTGSLRLRIIPGAGLVARAGEGVLVVDRREARHAAAAGALLDALRATCGTGDPSPGERLVRRLVGEAVQRDPADVPPFGALAPGRGGVDVLLTPGMVISWLDGDEERTLSGTQAATFVDRVVPWEAGRVAIGVEPLDSSEHDPLSDLRDGATAARGAVVEWSGAAGAAAGGGEAVDDDETEVRPTPVSVVVPPSPRPPSPAEAPVPPTPFEVVDLGGGPPAEPRDPLPVADAQTAERLGLPAAADTPPTSVEAPLVDGLRCPPEPEGGPRRRGGGQHFNHPHARYCVQCGIDMGQITPAIVKGPRPPLGILIVDDGSAYSLDIDYVVGREPELDPAVASGHARAILFPDPDRAISRVHADVRLVGWDVTITDRGSANGTFVLAPGAAAWSQLPSRQTTALVPGARVAIGQRTLVYESHHVS